ncbi:type II toxin-antitoxin system RelE/ParE family toxin [Candidatus Aerophobetes bacterium]|nr:type II toxin-antitoxin system RelE/ParE family toxin [Candidatus Aerophobetes bacterium]
MPKFNIVLTESAQIDLQQIESNLRLKLLKKLKILENSPFPISTVKSIRKIKASHKIALFRLRFGTYRIIYYIKDKMVYVLAVVQRKEFEEAIKNII